MADLAQLGLSLDAKPMLTGLEAVDQALAKTAAAADALVGKIKTATGQMAAAFSKVNDGGAAKQAATVEKLNFAIEHQAKAYRALLTVMREDAAIAKSATAQRILLNSALASSVAEIDAATVAGAKNLAGLRSETAATTSLAVAQGGLTASEKQLLDAKIRKAAVTKAYTDSVRAEITGATQQIALANAHVAAYHRETAAIKERNTALAATRKAQEALGRDIIAAQGRQNAALGLSSAGKDLFAPFANDPKVLAANKQQIALSDAHTAALKREAAATQALADKEAARIAKSRAKAASDLRLLPILSTGSVGLPTKATSAFNEPDIASRLTPASGNARIDATREALAKLRIEEAALHQQLKAGEVTRKEYAQRMREITRETNLAVTGNSRARGAFRQTASAIASATFEITGAVFGLTAAFGALASPAVFGFKLLRTMEDTKLGLSGILISMGEINGEAIKLPKALELAEGMTQRLQQNALKFGVDMIALADTTKAVLASGLGGGLALKEVEEIALLGSIAVKTIGLDARQSVQEIRDLVAGGIQAGSSTLAVALGITNEDVKRWREAGTLFDNLKVKLKGFQDTAILKQDTLNGAWTIFVQKIQLLLANGPAFDLIKQKLTDISNAVGGFNADTGQFEFNPELVKTVEDYYAAFKQVVGVLADAGRLIVELIPLVIELGKAFLLLKAINLSGTLAKGLLEVGGAAASATKAIITGVGGAKNKVSELTGVLNGIGKNPIVQVIGVEIAWNFGQWVGTQLNTYFGDFFARELEKINKLIYNFGGSIKATLLDALAAVFNWGPISRLLGIPEFFSNMADEIRRGADKATAAAAAQAGRIARISAQYDSVQSEGGLVSTGKVNGGNDRLLAEEMALVGGDIVTGKTGAADPGKTSRGSGGGGADPQIAFMEGLRKEAETLGLGEEALKRYEVSKMKLSVANRRLADTYLDTIFVFKAEQEAAKAANEEAQKKLDAEEEQIKAAEDLAGETRKGLEQIQFETSLLSMNTEERYKAIAAREVESNVYTQGNAELAKSIALREKEADQLARISSLLANTQTAKTQDFMANVDAANAFFFEQGGSEQQYEEMIGGITGATGEAKDKLSELDQFTSEMAKNMQNSLAEFFFDPFKDGLDGMLKDFGTLLQRMIAEAAAKQVMQSLFGKAAGGVGSGWIGAGLEWLGGLFASANGNAFSGGQPQAFASGGILGANGGMLTQPTIFPMANGGLGLGGEAGVEAVMPLKRGSDGKLGVAAAGGGQRNSITVIVQGGQSAPDVRRAAGQGAREAWNLLNGAQRYA